MKIQLLVAALLISTGAALPLPAHAGPGHDHGHDESAPAASGPALPRFAAESEAFELVGVLNGLQLTLYLDRATDNAPVTGAQIELDIAGTTLKAQPNGDAYDVLLPEPPRPGLLPITATVTADQDVDLLAAELDLQDPTHAAQDAHTHVWAERAGWAAAALAAIAGLVVIGRRWVASRQRPSGAAA